ncbi:MAG: hypothetical protein ABEI86_13560, partial [Halobacteriaceae archaeon]
MITAVRNRTIENIELLLFLSLFLYAIKYGVTAPVPNELVYEMKPWNDMIGVVTKSLNHSQTLLSYFGLERFSSPPEPIGGTWVGPARRLPFTILYVLITPLYTGDYLQAFQLSYKIAIIFTAIISFPITGYVIHRLVTNISTKGAGLLALFGFLGLQIIGWPGKAIYSLKPQHAMAIPICLLVLYCATKTIQTETSDDRSRYALLTGIILGISGLTQYHYTLITILSVFIAFTVQKMWKSLVRTSMTGLAFASFYIIIPQAGKKIINKTIGVFSGNGGGRALFTVSMFINSVITPGIILILLISGIYVTLYLFSEKQMVKGYLLDISILFTWLLWFVPKSTSLRDAEAVIALWFLKPLLLIAIIFYFLELFEDRLLNLYSR